MKRTWIGYAFFTNESAWSAMVTGPHSRVGKGHEELYDDLCSKRDCDFKKSKNLELLVENFIVYTQNECSSNDANSVR